MIGGNRLEREKELRTEVIRALLDEMQFWNRQLDEHARLIRSGVDLGEDNTIREADQFVVMYDRLLSRLNTPGLIANSLIVSKLLYQTKILALSLREFKIEVENGIAQCRIKAILPADLINHIRRELDFFIGNLNAVTEGPIPTWGDLGLDHSNRKVSLVPRMLLEEIEGKLVYQVSLEELLFFTHISADHAKLLAGYFKPIEQAQFTQETLQFGAEFDRLHQLTFQEKNQRGNLAGIMQTASDLNQSWLNYLTELNILLATCQIPALQANFWPALGVHIYREQLYFQSILLVLIPRTKKENC
jgi:hypothetical protein